MEGEPLMWINGWCLVSADKVDGRAKDLIGEGNVLVSFMWHDCGALKFEYIDEGSSEEDEIKYLDAEDSQMGKCWYCMEQAPHDLHTVWMIHNMSLISSLLNPNEESWTPKYIEKRIKDIERCKKKGRKEGYYNG
jgi:hypothetical protein